MRMLWLRWVSRFQRSFRPAIIRADTRSAARHLRIAVERALSAVELNDVVAGRDCRMRSIWLGRVVISVERRDMRIEGGGMLVGGSAGIGRARCGDTDLGVDVV